MYLCRFKSWEIGIFRKIRLKSAKLGPKSGKLGPKSRKIEIFVEIQQIFSRNLQILNKFGNLRPLKSTFQQISRFKSA
jgi:hypothetical protein